MGYEIDENIFYYSELKTEHKELLSQFINISFLSLSQEREKKSPTNSIWTESENIFSAYVEIDWGKKSFKGKVSPEKVFWDYFPLS